jgi:hypothetical protein
VRIMTAEQHKGGDLFYWTSICRKIWWAGRSESERLSPQWRTAPNVADWWVLLPL